MEIAIQGLLLLSSAFMGGFFGARRFVRERRWETKNRAYQNIVEAVHTISYWAEQHYADLHFFPSAGKKKFEELADAVENAREELWRQAAIGELYLSRSTAERVDKLRRDLEQAAIWFEHERTPESWEQDFSRYCELIREAVDDHLPHVLYLARRDLEGWSLASTKMAIRGGPSR